MEKLAEVFAEAAEMNKNKDKGKHPRVLTKNVEETQPRVLAEKEAPAKLIVESPAKGKTPEENTQSKNKPNPITQ